MSLAGYTTILLTGRTGRGKSTTGNKLIGVGLPGARQHIFVEECDAFPGLLAVHRKGEIAQFDPSSGIESSTKKFKILTNRNRKICVIDGPGFGDSAQAAEQLSMLQNNLALFKQLKLIQMANKFTIHRIIYFLPSRGPPEKVEGNMSEELKVLYDFCGPKVFDSMIVVATQHRLHQRYSFGEDSIRTTKEIIHESMTTHLKIQTNQECLPAVIYLPLDIAHDDIVPLILENTKVRNKNGIDCIVSEDFCEDCGSRLIYPDLAKVIEKDERTHCMAVKDIAGTYHEYKESKCHGYIIPKYTTLQKIVGGVGHIFTLGIPFLVQTARGKESWQGWFTNDLWCNNCHETPGKSLGCIKMSKEQVHKKIIIGIQACATDT